MTHDEYRSESTLTGTEREQLEAFVHDNRLEILAVLDGLTEEQARRRLVPSLTTPLAIVKHAVFVEKVWFHVSLAGRSRAEVGIPEAAEDSWVLADEDTVASVRAAIGVRGAAVTSTAIGGTSLMSVTFGGDAAAFAAALRTRGYNVRQSGNTFSISR